MSFDIVPNFKVANIYLGEPGDDYNLWAKCAEPCQLGALVSNDKIESTMKALFAKYIKPGFEFDIYENIFSKHPKFVYLKPTFSDSKLFLIDRYVSLFVRPDFSTLLNFINLVSCNETTIKESDHWFWRVVCLKKATIFETIAEKLFESAIEDDGMEVVQPTFRNIKSAFFPKTSSEESIKQTKKSPSEYRKVVL